ncbi:MAG: septum formation family protein [Bifidobacteriaceae bacterium]|nr:septum formation family protein [Bifidobacteriaceae bacterium]
MKSKFAVLTALAISVSLTGCGFLDRPKEAPRDESGKVVESAQADVFSLKIGDCTGQLDEGDISESLLIPCEEPHYWEVFVSQQLKDDELPADVEDQALEFCNSQFTNFIGLSFDESVYEFFYMYPTPDTWKYAHDREILCLVGSDAGGLVGSLKDVAA